MDPQTQKGGWSLEDRGMAGIAASWRPVLPVTGCLGGSASAAPVLQQNSRTGPGYDSRVEGQGAGRTVTRSGEWTPVLHVSACVGAHLQATVCVKPGGTSVFDWFGLSRIEKRRKT